MNIFSWVNPNLFYRFLARQVDYTLLFFVFLALKDLVPEVKEFTDQYPQIFFHLGILFVWNFLEAAILLKFNSTLGKKLFGIKVITQDSTYKKYLVRSLEIFIKAMAFGLPLLSSITNVYFYFKSYKTGETPWDKKLNFKVEQQPINLFLRLGVLLMASIFSILIVGSLMKTTKIQEVKTPLETTIVPFPNVKEEEEILPFKEWVKYCTNGAINYASKHTYLLNSTDLHNFCEAQAEEFLEEASGLVAKQQACSYGIAYAYSQVNKGTLEALEQAIDNPVFFEMEIKKHCQDPDSGQELESIEE